MPRSQTRKDPDGYYRRTVVFHTRAEIDEAERLARRCAAENPGDLPPGRAHPGRGLLSWYLRWLLRREAEAKTVAKK